VTGKHSVQEANPLVKPSSLKPGIEVCPGPDPGSGSAGRADGHFGICYRQIKAV